MSEEQKQWTRLEPITWEQMRLENRIQRLIATATQHLDHAAGVLHQVQVLMDRITSHPDNPGSV